MEILVEAKDRGLDLRVINTDGCFTTNCPQPTGGPEDSSKEL